MEAEGGGQRPGLVSLWLALGSLESAGSEEQAEVA